MTKLFGYSVIDYCNLFACPLRVAKQGGRGYLYLGDWLFHLVFHFYFFISSVHHSAFIIDCPAAPRIVLCPKIVILIPLVKTLSGLIRPIVTAIPRPVSRSNLVCGRRGFSVTTRVCAGAIGNPRKALPKSVNTFLISLTLARRPSDMCKSSKCPSNVQTR